MPAEIFAIKKEVAEQVTWLKIFVEPIEKKIADRLKPFRNEQPHYEPLHVELLLGDVSRLLDSCLAYRREANDLDATATKTALEIQLFEKLKDKDKELGKLGLAAEQSEKLADAQKKAAEAFGLTTEEGSSAISGDLAAMKKGMGEQAVGAQQVGEISAANEKRKGKLLDERWALLIENQEKLKARHEAEGNGLNYGERYKRVVDLLLEDIEEAYRKALSVKAGLKEIYESDKPATEYSDPLPDFDKTDFLDEFVKWTRKAIRMVEEIQQDEVEMDFVVPLNHPWRFDAGEDQRMMTKDQFSLAIQDKQDGRLTFDTTPVFPKELFEHLRLKSIAVTYSSAEGPPKSGERDELGMRRYTVLVFPPMHNRALGPARAQEPRRPPVMLSNVGILNQESGPNFVGGLGLMNIDPRGTWEIRLLPVGLGATKDVYHRWAGDKGKPWVSDLNLHLRVLCKPESDPNKWNAWCGKVKKDA